VVELLGRAEAGELDDAGRALLRILTPVAKLTTARQGVSVASEIVESFGGAGYLEDTGIPTLLRDAQVLSIWEGTTNVLALDTLRAMESAGGLEPIVAEVARCAADVRDASLAAPVQASLRAVERAAGWLREARRAGEAEVQAGARRFALTLGRALEAVLLANHAQWAIERGDPRPAAAARRLAANGIDLIASHVSATDARLLVSERAEAEAAPEVPSSPDADLEAAAAAD
jgi:hypothetical protein